MKRLFNLTIAVILIVVCANEASAQSNRFRDTRAHLGVGLGLFTFHGPIDLLKPSSKSNFVRESDPAVVFFGSFPIVGDLFYFRGMVLFTNFSTKDGRRLVGDGMNEFLTQDVLIFEPEVVMTLRPGSKSRIMPYIFTGFGGTIADVFGSESRDKVDLPGTGVPGPERSVFHLPVGFGVDIAFNGCWSIYGEASWRFDLNYVFKNEPNYNKHDTSLIMGGLRMCLRGKKPVAPPPAPIPPPLPVPKYAPPLLVTPQVCRLVEMNSVFFAYNSAELNEEARRFLDENIDALRLTPTCCVEIKGWTDRDDNDVYALRLSRQRAEIVYRYYLSQGLSAERFTVTAAGIGETCGKEAKGEGPGCPRSRRVDSLPFDCSLLLR